MNSDDIDKQVKEFIKKGGKIKRIPGGVSADRPLNVKKKLFGLTKRPKPGFHATKMILSPSKNPTGGKK
jgi:hypothetical protein